MKYMRFILTLIIGAIILAASATIWGAEGDISVPKAGSYYYWFTYSDLGGKDITTMPRQFKDKKTTADLPLVKDAVPKSTILYVLNASTGNEAIISVGEKPGPIYKLNLKTEDFNYARKVKIEVVSASNEAPVAACTVKLAPQSGSSKKSTAKSSGMVANLDPSYYGVAEFNHVPAGTSKVSVDYGDGKSASQDVDISMERQTPILTVKMPVVGEVDTVQPASTEAKSHAKGDGSPAEEKVLPGRHEINFASALMGLIILFAILYVSGIMLKKKGVAIKDALKKAGIDLPEDAANDAGAKSAPAAQADPTICPFCGGKKDPKTGECACSVSGNAPASQGYGSGARLIATQGTYIGNIYPLSNNEVIIGREESNPIAFPQDIAVSRKHAKMSKAGETWSVSDMGSSNGTFVNGAKVSEAELHPGDEIQVGSTRLRFEI